jgi:hypothetical protein
MSWRKIMKTQLLATFTTKIYLDGIVDKIKSTYPIVFDKIYILQNEDSPKELICTYNVDMTNAVDYNAIENTISLHRKKHTNTLYTINALNEVVMDMNNGVKDPNTIVPWENYKNSILVTNADGLNKINTRIFKIIKI